MLRINELRLNLGADEKEILEVACKEIKINRNRVKKMSVAKRSVDSRHKNDIHLVYSVELETDLDEQSIASHYPQNKVCVTEKYEYSLPQNRRASSLVPVIAGFGPAGMFAALMLARAGLKPVVLERGADVEKREKLIETFHLCRVLDENTNAQFGEGGAGAFSDGKLTTGIKDARCREVFCELVRFGAPEDILYSATPHIGTDRLPGVVKRLREEVISLGGDIRFNSTLTDIIAYNGHIQGVSVRTTDGEEYDLETDTLILATGHSSRDTYEMLYSKGIALEQKPFSVGARIEHPQEYINKLRYGAQYANPLLPAADYKLSDHPLHGRGAYTFCMCPGGTVVAASSEKGCVTVNGMSRFKRDGENANSAVLAGIEPCDFPDSHVLSGMYMQREIERKAFELGGGDYSAPAQLLNDFLNGVPSTSGGSVTPSCPTGVRWTDITSVLPHDAVNTMKRGLKAFNVKLSGFILHDAVLTAPETRSSSPVRVLRNEFMMSPKLDGLIPCGEGAGYAGGIVSAAVDGIKAAEAVITDENIY